MRIPRKLEHVHHALQLGQSGEQGFADIRIVPNCLPEASINRICLQTVIGELILSSPIIINAMTGGAQETEAINRELAVAARETGLAMAVGSQMAAIRHADAASSYTVVRKINPDGIVFGNLGSEATLEQAERAVEMIKADALQIHLNVMQELIMPEGDRQFTGMLERIALIAARVGVPVIVKEVGFGIAQEGAAALLQAGVNVIDTGGSGGTNFAAIENARRTAKLDWLNDWGCTTAVALLEVLKAAHAQQSSGGGDRSVSVIASGGIRSSLEIGKALIVGASAVGMAGALLRVLQYEGTAALIERIDTFHQEIKLIMTALGASSIAGLRQVPVVILGETAQWCGLRGVDIGMYARRNRI
ncbi:type 2 isopentenyl-diphosphate Delta-isomerase [Paenibacillus piri]|uniref:Isopentenyl-diphosphate delta-isomerase n=1 Tax=Paenibacillus piri TaxID=2547395 RepID=A0A4R5KWC8_9BACL|nr:type 2 isopentenyl-diphosphate Delta-isomerase [Paenibacillus piri]TDF99327.1 type 2 isopentenyl-diphosphate Delta-isomerase [Paenibacillus piri]